MNLKAFFLPSFLILLLTFCISLCADTPKYTNITNNYVTIKINDYAYVESIDYKGEEQIKNPTPLSTVYFKDGSFENAASFMRVEDNLYRLTYYDSSIQLLLRITPENGYVTFTIDDLINPEGEELSEVRFFEFNPKKIPQHGPHWNWAKNASDDTLFMHALPFTLETQCGLRSARYVGEASAAMGIVGASGCLITVPKALYFSTIKDIILSHDLPYAERNGEWFRDGGFYGDSYLFTVVYHSNHEKLLDYAKRGGFGQFLMQSPFVYGFYNKPPSGRFKNFDQMCEDMQKFIDEGIKIGVHTFINSIQSHNTLCTVDKVCKVPIGALGHDAGPDDIVLNLEEGSYDNDEIKHYGGVSGYDGSAIRYIFVIEDEAVSAYYADGTLSDCKRGKLRSTPDAHPKGSTVYIVPTQTNGDKCFFDPGGPAQLESIESFAETVNRLGVNFVYFDGHMFCYAYGMSNHFRGNFALKNGAMPYLNACPKIPTVQVGSSALPKYSYYFRDRGASWDGVVFENKMFTRNFKTKLMLRQSPYADVRSEMGWWKFNGAKFSDGRHGIDATTFDDVHYAMTKVVALERSIGLQLSAYHADHARITELFDLVGKYHELIRKDIKGGIIPDDLKEYLSNLDVEAELVGGSGFLEKKFLREYVAYSEENPFETSLENPFSEQSLKLELRPRFDYYGFDDPRHLLMADFSDSTGYKVSTSKSYITCEVGENGMVHIENTGKSKGSCTISVPGTYDMTFKRGVGISLTGDGKNEALVVRLGAGHQWGKRDYIVPIDFSGEKTFLLGKVDPTHSLRRGNWNFDFSSVNQLEICVYEIAPGQTYDIQLHSLKALQEKTQTPLLNPTITVNSETITFPVSLYVDDENPHILEYDGTKREYKLYTSNHEYLSSGTIDEDNIVIQNGTNALSFTSDSQDPENLRRADLRINIYAEVALPHLAGDVNKDGKVDLQDLVIVARAFGSGEGDPNWNPDADLNEDGTVNLSDLVEVARRFGDGV